ncbi:hypothetical protein C8J56DRAFT_911898 [Mycena floridula]|nr:hypothetical protein C8J56DRAFT_911898 [Mycena floridula]
MFRRPAGILGHNLIRTIRPVSRWTARRIVAPRIFAGPNPVIRFNSTATKAESLDTSETQDRSEIPSLNELSDAEFEELVAALEETTPTNVSDEDAVSFVLRAKERWPVPKPPLPKGWSASWEEWKYLFTFYWFSPYYLMLQQIEIFEEVGNKWFFVIEAEDDEPSTIYCCDCETLELTQLDGIHDEEILVEALREGGYSSLSFIHIMPDPLGVKTLERILERDETVIPLLGQRFLTYTPKATTPEMEIPDYDWSGQDPVEELKHLEDLEKSLDLGEEDPEDDELDSSDPEELRQQLRDFMQATDAIVEQDTKGQEMGEELTLDMDEEVLDESDPRRVDLSEHDQEELARDFSELTELHEDLQREIIELQELEEEAAQDNREPEESSETKESGETKETEKRAES